MMKRRHVLAAGLLMPGIVRTQGFPGQTITIVAPFAPGASADSIARIVGEGLSVRLGQTVIIDNKPGAGGTTGLIGLSRAEPDGYTLGIGAAGAVLINPHIPSASSGFKPLEELDAISMLVDVPLIIIAQKTAGYRTLKEAIDASKTSDGGLSYGTTGINSAQHLAMELLKRESGANLVHVPYKGSAPAVTDVLGGQLPLACVDGTSAAAYLKSGDVVGLAVTSAKRAPFASDVPTIAEAGVSAVELTAFLGMFAPKGLPEPVQAKLQTALSAILADQTTRQKIAAVSCTPNYADKAAFSQYLAQTSEQMGGLLKSLGAQ